MDTDKLPTDHDVIVLGTGMTESIVAAALSRIGLRVLHLDRNDSYGDDWGAFNFTALQQWIQSTKDQTEVTDVSFSSENLSSHLSSDEKLVLLPSKSSTISNVMETIHIPGKPESKVSDNTDTGITLSLVNSTETSNESDTAVTESQCIEGIVDQDSVESSYAGDATVNQEAKLSKETDEETATKKKQMKKEDKLDPVPSETLDFAGVTRHWRKFSIDLMPKILYNRGPLVELLISSDVSKYCEFRCITRILTMLKGKLEVVPCSRADVFASHDVSVIEKRLLMKFLTFAIEYQKHPTQYAGFEDRTFVEFLKSKRLTETIQHYVQHAIAMVTETATTLEGLEATQKFLLSLGRYGNTAFLWPLYGSGELLQCFCRMCAVFGGIYCLRRSAQSIILNSSKEVCSIIDTEGQRLETKWLIMNASYASDQFLPQVQNFGHLSRGILITDRSFKPHKEQQITIMSLPLPGRNDSRATVYELSSLSATCPEGYHVVHLMCKSLAQNAAADLQPVVELLFQNPGHETENDDRPRIIWSLYFNIADTSGADLTCNDMRNLFVVGGPDISLDCDQSIAVARNVFEKICPGEEFLPRAPNPEDIIFDDGETPQSRQSGFEPIPESSSEGDIPETKSHLTESSDAQISDASMTAGIGQMVVSSETDAEALG